MQGFVKAKSGADGASLSCYVRKSLNFADGPASLDVKLDIARGEWIALLGPSGAGKTTLLRVLAGLTQPDAGYIRIGTDLWLDSENRYSLPTRQRRLGFVFQDLALFPHMTARRNISFALPCDERPGKADEFLDLVGLSGLADRLPAQLSGGQQQRLALARALAARPRLLLLDEPLSALDRRLRIEMQALLLDIRHRQLADYAVLVTHDEAEAESLATRRAEIEHGRLVQFN